MFLKKAFLVIAITATALCASAANPKKSGGFFFAYNDTDRSVTIGVGNFFPSEYTIDPHSYRTVFVSTDNQNIHIKSIS